MPIQEAFSGRSSSTQQVGEHRQNQTAFDRPHPPCTGLPSSPRRRQPPRASRLMSPCRRVDQLAAIKAAKKALQSADSWNARQAGDEGALMVLKDQARFFCRCWALAHGDAADDRR